MSTQLGEHENEFGSISWSWIGRGRVRGYDLRRGRGYDLRRVLSREIKCYENMGDRRTVLVRQ
jgi:hypothetical protein